MLPALSLASFARVLVQKVRTDLLALLEDAAGLRITVGRLLLFRRAAIASLRGLP
jgi:hypothetical protein